MKSLPAPENALLIRTDFMNAPAWEQLLAVARAPEEPFIFNMEVVADWEYDGASVEQLISALHEDYAHSFIVVADKAAMVGPEYPLLVVDVAGEPGLQFRSVAAQVASVDNNLVIANMGFEEFLGALDPGGTFRGIPRM